MRERGFGPMVNSVERWWYTKNKPPEGGTPEGGLPTAAAPTTAAVGRIPTDLALLVGSVQETLVPRTDPPLDMQPFVDTPLPGEGVWGRRRRVGRGPRLGSDHQVGRDRRERGARVALRGRGRRQRRPDLHRRARALGQPARGAVPPGGAVQAMELDINSDWTTGCIFEQTDPDDPAAITGNKLLPDMKRGGDRYLVPGERDFVTMVARY